jgi:uncharacterized membrane protein YkgB
MKQGYLIIIGFIMFFLGAISIILTLVGMKLDLIGFLYAIGSGFALLIHLILMFGGVCLMYYAKNRSKMLKEMQDSQ